MIECHFSLCKSWWWQVSWTQQVLVVSCLAVILIDHHLVYETLVWPTARINWRCQDGGAVSRWRKNSRHFQEKVTAGGKGLMFILNKPLFFSTSVSSQVAFVAPVFPLHIISCCRHILKQKESFQFARSRNSLCQFVFNICMTPKTTHHLKHECIQCAIALSNTSCRFY